MTKATLKILPLLLAVVIATGLALANMTTADAAWPGFTVFVYDAADNSSLEGVTVKLVQGGTPQKTEISDVSGSISFLNVDAGAYTVEVEGSFTIGGFTYVLDKIENKNINVTDNSGPDKTPAVYMKRVYQITVNDDGNGTGSASPNQSARNEIITLTATANAGFTFKEWQTAGGIVIPDTSANPATFTMPERDVTVTAIFEQIPDNPVPNPSRSDSKSDSYAIMYFKNIQDGEDPFYIQGNYYKGDTAVVTDREPTRKGYRFLYWTDNSVDHGKHYSAGDKITMYGDSVRYAQWELVPEESTPTPNIENNVNDNPSTGS